MSKTSFDPKVLKNYLASIGKTQQDVADELGVKIQTVNAYVSGKARFGRRTAAVWAKRYGISPMWLLTGEGEITGDKKTGGGAFDVDASRLLGELEADREALRAALDTIKTQQETIEKLVSLIERRSDFPGSCAL